MITQTNAVSRIKWYAKQIDETSELLPAAKTKAEREIHRSLKLVLGMYEIVDNFALNCLIIAFGLVRIGNLVLNYPDKFNVELKNRNYDE